MWSRRETGLQRSDPKETGQTGTGMETEPEETSQNGKAPKGMGPYRMVGREDPCWRWSEGPVQLRERLTGAVIALSPILELLNLPV